MTLHPERVMVFIDGSNLYHASRKRGLKIDYQKILQTLAGSRRLVRPYLYIGETVPLRDSERKFHEMLRFAGYTVVSKPLRLRRFQAKLVDSDFDVFVERWQEKGVDVALVTDMLSLGYKNAYDTAILIGGDEDYVSAIENIKAIPKRVELAAFSDTDVEHDPPFFVTSVNREMRMLADFFYPLENLVSEISRV